MNRLLTQLRVEVTLVVRNSEQLLLTIIIPVLLLVFFSLVDVLPTETKDPVDFLAPGILALAVMSSATSGSSPARSPTASTCSTPPRIPG